MEENKGVEVGIIWIKGLGVVQGVEVLDVAPDLESGANAILDNSAKGILRRAGRKRIFVVSISHTFGTDKDQVEGGAGEEPG